VVLDNEVDEIDLDNNLLDPDEEVQTLKLKARTFFVRSKLYEHTGRP
jgi:hypothetical protein